EVVLDRRRRVDDDLEVMAAGAGRDLTAWRRQLDASGHLLPDFVVARVEANAHGPPRNDELLGPSVRLERGAQPLDVDAGNEEVSVLRLVPEQLVAHGAADDVRVQPERADIVLDCFRRERSPRSRPARPRAA